MAKSALARSLVAEPLLPHVAPQAVQMDAGGAKFDFRLMSFNVLADTLVRCPRRRVQGAAAAACLLAWPGAGL